MYISNASYAHTLHRHGDNYTSTGVQERCQHTGRYNCQGANSWPQRPPSVQLNSLKIKDKLIKKILCTKNKFCAENYEHHST